MITPDPYEMHPEDIKKPSCKKKSKSIDFPIIKDLVLQHLEKIKKEKIPVWGYNQRHIDSFFYDLITDIESKIGEKDDS